MFRKTLVPLDGSSFAEAAVGPALALAHRGEGMVRLIAVRPPLSGLASTGAESPVDSYAEDYFEALRKTWGEGVEIDHAVREGDVAEEIGKEAEAWDAAISW